MSTRERYIYLKNRALFFSGTNENLISAYFSEMAYEFSGGPSVQTLGRLIDSLRKPRRPVDLTVDFQSQITAEEMKLIVDSLLKTGLIEELYLTSDEHDAWPTIDSELKAYFETEKVTVEPQTLIKLSQKKPTVVVVDFLEDASQSSLRQQFVPDRLLDLQFFDPLNSQQEPEIEEFKTAIRLADVIVGLFSDHSLEVGKYEIETFDRQVRSEKKAWLPLKADNNGAVLGPCLGLPGGPCISCLEYDLLNETFFGLNPSHRGLASFLKNEIYKLAFKLPGSRSLSKTIEIDLWNYRTRVVNPNWRPHCHVCNPVFTKEILGLRT